MTYAMYTEQGDLVAARVTDLAKAAGLDWPQTLKLMEIVSDMNPDLCGELMDTEVRELIYCRCKFTTAFYC